MCNFVAASLHAIGTLSAWMPGASALPLSLRQRLSCVHGGREPRMVKIAGEGEQSVMGTQNEVREIRRRILDQGCNLLGMRQLDA